LPSCSRNEGDARRVGLAAVDLERVLAEEREVDRALERGGVLGPIGSSRGDVGERPLLEAAADGALPTRDELGQPLLHGAST
jgi:hypothetical protein